MADVQYNKLKLEKHQQKAYENVERLFDEKGKAAVIFPTGCGKSFVVLKYILELMIEYYSCHQEMQLKIKCMNIL